MRTQEALRPLREQLIVGFERGPLRSDWAYFPTGKSYVAATNAPQDLLPEPQIKTVVSCALAALANTVATSTMDADNLLIGRAAIRSEDAPPCGLSGRTRINNGGVVLMRHEVVL